MKTVSGEVVSTKPVSLSKAAKILSKFASSDNGASPAFVAYLKRASASFDELAQLHKYKKPGDGHKDKRSKESAKPREVKAKVKSNILVTNHVEIEKENGRVKKVKEEAESINVDEQKKHKSKKRKKRSKEEGET